MSYDDKLSFYQSVAAEGAKERGETYTQSTPTSSQPGSADNSKLAFYQRVAAEGAQERSESAPQTTPTASDRGRGRTSHLRQSMAEGSYTQNLATTPEELAYYNAVSQGYNLDTWYSKAEAESNAASERYSQLKAQLDELKSDAQKDENSQRFARTNMLAKILGIGQSGEDKSAELSNLEQAVKQAQAEADKKSEELRYAKQYKDYRDTTRPVDEAAERGVGYADQYEAYSQSLKALNAEKQKLTQQLSDIRGGRAGYFGQENADAQEKAEKDTESRIERLTREIERIEGQRNYASLNLGKDKNAAVIIRQGEELSKNLKEVWDNNTELMASTMSESRAARFRDKADRYHPTANWTPEQQAVYNYLLAAPNHGAEDARDYAAQINDAINRGLNAAATAQDYAWGAQADGNFLQKAGATAALLPAGIAAAPSHALSWMEKISDVMQGNPYVKNAVPTLADRIGAATKGRAEQLNKNGGTVSEAVPIVGGKGFGDLFQLGQSVVQSAVMGNLVGEGATLAAFFAQAADSAFDEAKARGGSDEYAAMFSTLSGLAEVLGEKISLDHMLKGGNIGSLKYILKQAGIEGAEEVNTSVLNQFFDRITANVTGDQTAIQDKISALVRQGMSYEEAEKQVWKETVEDVAWDFVGGFVSGGMSGAVQSGVRGTQNKLWEMRKDSVLGKQNAEGQREGGKKNASNDELSKMFDRALKRGDIRGAEQILQVIEQRNTTEEEQEYGPVDPTANERMRKRLERQLNGESLNPETENAEVVEESAVNRQLAEEARVQAEFPTVSPITMELVRRLDGKDFVTMAKSMTTQELAEVARYARSIGEDAKADLLERIRLDPTYQYEEQPPAHTDEEVPPLNTSQNAAGVQQAPAGQIAQPSQQNAAQTVKPVDSATAENKLFNVTQNPNGVSTRSTESGTMTVPNTQEVTTNAGEQAVQQPEEAGTEAADFGVGRRPAGAGAAAGQLGASENAAEGEQRAQERTGRALPRFAQEDVNELSDVEESAPITQEQRDEYSSLTPLTNDGIQVVSKPQIGSRLHLAWSLAKKLGQNVLFARNYNGSVFKDGSTAYQAKGKVIVDADNTQMELPTAVAHEAGHDKYFRHFGGYADIVNGAYTKRLNFFTGVFNDALGAMKGLQTMRTAEKYIRDDRGYGRRYDRSRERYTQEVRAKITNPLAQNATNLVAEMEKARSVEEFMNQLLAYDVDFLDAMSDETGIPIEDIYKLRESLLSGLQAQGIFTAEEIAAINDAAIALEDGNFTDDLSDEEEAFSPEVVDADAEAANFKGDLGRAVRKAAVGDTSYMKNAELLAVLNYALDRAAPTSKGQTLSERLSDLYNEYGNSATSYISEAGDYFGRHVGNLSEGKTDNLMRTVDTVLRELDRRGYSFDRVQSMVDNFENKFGLVEDKTLTEFYRGKNGPYGVSKKKNSFLDLSQEAKEETSREDADRESEIETESNYDRRNMKRDLDALRNGTNFVKEAVPTKPEDHGWIKPVEVSEKEVKRARDAVEAKGKEAELKDRIKTLEAQKGYLTAVADAMRKARSGLYGSENIEQRKSDLGYIADGLNEQLEQLDADLGYVADGVVGTEEEAAIDNILAQKDRANAQLNALRDEYKHLGEDSAALRNVRTQIDSVVSEIAALSRQLDGVSKRAERADWGSNKRTLFQAEMAENPARETGSEHVEPNVYGPYTSPKNRALNGVFRQQVKAELDVDAEAADFGEPTRGMGTGYVGMQRSRNKDGSLEFRTMYDDALPTRPATDKSRKPLAAPSTAYSNVAQAARSILNSKNSFLDFSKDRPKDIPSKVTNTMGQLREHVREMMEGDHPVNALMQLSNMVHEFENDDDLRVFSSDSIKKAVDELNDIYYNQDITNEEKAQRMVENATRTLTLISKRVQLVDKGYNMLKTFTGPRKKRDGTTLWSKFKAMQLNPSTLFKAMDGFARDKNGSGYQIAKMIENGTALYTITQTQALKRLSEISGLEGFKEFSEGNATPFNIDGVKITEQQAVEFIMQVRNLQNTDVTGKDGPTNRLNTIDGFSIVDKDGKNTFIERSEEVDGTNAEWFLNLAEAMENSLSPAAKKYLETATEILDDLGRQTSDIRTNLIGTGFEGFINGTYYPITYGNRDGRSNSQQNNPVGLFSGPSYQSRTRNVGGYVNIKNVSDTMDRYIHWASNTIGYGEVAELLQVMNSTGGRMQNLSTLANEMLGQGYSEYISKFVDDVNEVPDGQKNNNSALAVLRRNMASGALLGNLGVAAKQAASLWSGVGVLSPQALLSAETYFGGHTGAGNVLLQSRSTGTSLDPTISEILHNDSFMGKLMKRSGVTEFMGKATALVDYQTVKRLFAATVVDTKLSFPGMDQNSELFAQTVEAKFQDVVLQTQPIFVKNARAGYLRSNDELMKAFAMFRTQPTQNLNAIVTAVGEYNALKGTEFGKAAGKKLRNTIIGQTASAITFATLSAIVGFARHGWKKYRDDDDELSWAEVAKRIGLDTVESLAGISVFGGDLAKAIITMATGGEEKEFYDINAGVISMLIDTVSSVTTFGTNLVKAIKDDQPLAVFNADRQAADNLLQVGAGIPANTVYRLLNAATMYTAEAMYALSDGKLGNRANYDDALKMLDSYIKGNLTEEGAKTQAAKAFRKGQPENLLYNLGILSSLTEEGGQDKGRNYLDSLIKKSGDSDAEESKNRRIVDYLVHQAVSADKIDKAVEAYGASNQYNQFYEILRQNGHSPVQAVKKLDEIDTNGDSKITTDELQDYWKKHGHEPKENKLIEALFGPTADDFRIIKDTKTFESSTRYYKPVIDSGVTAERAVEIVDGCRSESGDVTQAGIYQYYLAHPEDIKQIQALYNSMGYKENGKPRTWESFLKYQAKQAAKKAS